MRERGDWEGREREKERRGREKQRGRGREGPREIDRYGKRVYMFGAKIEIMNNKETHRKKYRYYIVLYNQPRSILTRIYQAPRGIKYLKLRTFPQV